MAREIKARNCKVESSCKDERRREKITEALLDIPATEEQIKAAGDS